MRFLLAALMLLLPASAMAADAWQVRLPDSRLHFTGKIQGSEFEGRFTRYEADIVFDPAALDESAAVVVIDVTSFDSQNTDRDLSAPTSDWFHVAEYETARFETTSIAATGDNAYEATGNLTIKGTTKEIVLPFTLDIEGDEARMVGSVELNRMEFNLGTGDWADGDFVAHTVVVEIDLIADRITP